MAIKSNRTRRMPPEVKAAYGEIEQGVKHLGKSIAEIRQGLRRAERNIQADARARIRTLRQEAKTQLAGLQTQQREVTRTLRQLASAAEGSWEDVKRSADTVLDQARTVASAVIERFRGALGR